METTVDCPVEAEGLTTSNAIRYMEQVCTSLLPASKVPGAELCDCSVRNYATAAYGAWKQTVITVRLHLSCDRLFAGTEQVSVAMAL
jgi:hypothetical protein